MKQAFFFFNQMALKNKTKKYRFCWSRRLGNLQDTLQYDRYWDKHYWLLGEKDVTANFRFGRSQVILNQWACDYVSIKSHTGTITFEYLSQKWAVGQVWLTSQRLAVSGLCYLPDCPQWYLGWFFSPWQTAENIYWKS